MMPHNINGKTYYLAGEVVTEAGISRSTLTRWIANGRVAETTLRDRNNWRLFTKRELNAVVAEAHRVRELSG